MKRKISLILMMLAISTQTALGQSGALISRSSTLSSIIKNVIGVLGLVVPLLVSAAVIVFLYGVLRFIIKSSAGDADGRKEGIDFMIWGIIGIAVMVSVWGLVGFVTGTFGTTQIVPQFNASN